MTKVEHVKYWRDNAQHDLESDAEYAITYLDKIKEFHTWFNSLLK